MLSKFLTEKTIQLPQETVQDKNVDVISLPPEGFESVHEYLTSEEGRIYIEQVDVLLNNIEKWCEKHQINITRRINKENVNITPHEAIAPLRALFVPKESEEDLRHKPLYREGIISLTEIYSVLLGDDISIDAKKASMANLLQGLNVCSAGVYLNIKDAHDELSHNIEKKLMALREAYVNELIVEALSSGIKDRGIGMEIHIVNYVKSMIADKIGLAAKADHKYFRGFNKGVRNALKVIHHKFLEIYTSTNIVNGFFNTLNLTDLTSAVTKAKENGDLGDITKRFTKKLNEYGSDELWSDTLIYDYDEDDNWFIEPNAEQMLKLTLIRRLRNSGYFTNDILSKENIAQYSIVSVNEPGLSDCTYIQNYQNVILNSRTFISNVDKLMELIFLIFREHNVTCETAKETGHANPLEQYRYIFDLFCRYASTIPNAKQIDMAFGRLLSQTMNVPHGYLITDKDLAIIVANALYVSLTEDKFVAFTDDIAFRALLAKFSGYDSIHHFIKMLKVFPLQKLEVFIIDILSHTFLIGKKCTIQDLQTLDDIINIAHERTKHLKDAFTNPFIENILSVFPVEHIFNLLNNCIDLHHISSKTLYFILRRCIKEIQMDVLVFLASRKDILDRYISQLSDKEKFELYEMMFSTSQTSKLFHGIVSAIDITKWLVDEIQYRYSDVVLKYILNNFDNEHFAEIEKAVLNAPYIKWENLHSSVQLYRDLMQYAINNGNANKFLTQFSKEFYAKLLEHQETYPILSAIPTVLFNSMFTEHEIRMTIEKLLVHTQDRDDLIHSSKCFIKFIYSFYGQLNTNSRNVIWEILGESEDILRSVEKHFYDEIKNLGPIVQPNYLKGLYQFIYDFKCKINERTSLSDIHTLSTLFKQSLSCNMEDFTDLLQNLTELISVTHVLLMNDNNFLGEKKLTAIHLRKLEPEIDNLNTFKEIVILYSKYFTADEAIDFFSDDPDLLKIVLTTISNTNLIDDDELVVETRPSMLINSFFRGEFNNNNKRPAEMELGNDRNVQQKSNEFDTQDEIEETPPENENIDAEIDGWLNPPSP